MSTRRNDLGMLGGAALVLLASAVWFGAREAKIETTTRLLPVGEFETSGTRAEENEGGEFHWRAPTGDGREGGWTYDVFTPPDIYFDETSGRFAATAREAEEANAGIEKTDTEPAGLELVRVITRPFRVQLVGFAGGPGAYLGVFEDVATGETFLAGAGERVERAEVTIHAFTVERTEVTWPESMAVQTPVAKARVRDERTGETVGLTSAERTWRAEPFAVVRGIAGSDGEREVSTGEEVSVAGAVYRVEKIVMAPPAIELMRVEGKSEAGEPVRLVATLINGAR